MTFATWLMTIVIMLDTTAIRGERRESRELRCYQGCVETYRHDMSEGAAARLADCTDRCEGE